ncbi:hypothetical protein CDN89_13840 [Escherichia coli]|nr:hypothetical protein CDN89_13840 [Escherichia coli]
MTDFGGKTSIFSHPVYLFLRKFSLQDSRGGSMFYNSKRRHGSSDQMSPTEYKNQYYQRLRSV